MSHSIRCFTLASLAITLAAHAQIDLVADLRTGAINTQNTANPSGPFGILPTSAGPLALFPAPDPNYGRVLWKSDGTAIGTTLVRDYGIDNLTTQSPRDFVLYQNRLYFTSNLYNSSDLWICSSDGTSCGTRVHFRILNDGGTGGLRPGKLTVMGDWLYYVGLSPNNTTQGVELFRTDGTAANTTVVADLTPGGNGSSISAVVTNGSRLFLVATVLPNTIGNEFWISDGSTITPVDIAPGAASSNPTSLTILGNTCYFAASNSASGNELWKSDGTVNGTVLAADIMPGTSSSLPTNLSTHDGKLFFACNGRDENNLPVGNELFVFDGTTATLVADLIPGTPSSMPSRVISHGPDAYFTANDTTNIPRLFRTRATANTTISIAPTLRLNLTGGGGATADMASSANGVVFRAQPNTQTPFSLWVTDGTVGNAVNISSVYPNGSTTSGTSAYMTPLGDGRVIFSGATSSMNFEPWITDGTVNGTFQLRDIWTTAQGSTPQVFVPWNDQLTFFATALGTYRELYATGGTPSSTIPVLAIPPGPDERQLATFTPWAGGGALIATANAITPTQVLNFPTPGASPEILANDFSASNLTAINDTLLATAQGAVYTDLYILSAGNPPAFLDPVNRPHSFTSNSAVVMNGWLYFSAQREPDNFYWLWRTDGTTAEPIVELANGSDRASSISRMTRAGNRLYMRITTLFSGTELWTSDGTAQGTHIVTDLNPGTASGIVPNDILPSGVLGERLVFRAVHPTQGIELFITDGTANGTYSLGDINPGAANGASWINGTNVQVVGSTIFVAGTSPEYGNELWMSDGTPNSLTRITDLFPGPESSNPSRFTTDGQRLFFVAEGCDTGKELYSADTSGNVSPLTETVPGPEHGYIQQTMWFNGSLYFTYNHPAFGRELFRIRTAPCPADFNGDDILDLFDYLDFVSAFAANQPAADFNQDSVIDLFDYLDFVAAFASGC